MNYRRGFQRVYAVLTIAWISALLFTLPADRMKFWEATVWDSTANHQISTPDAAQKFDADEFMAQQRAQKQKTDTPRLPKGAILVPPDAASAAPIDYGSHSVLVDNGSDQLRIVKSDPLPAPSFSDSRTGKAMWLASALFAPPLVGYAAIFLMVPWIYRGFRH